MADTITGGYPKFVKEGLNDNYLPIWLQAEGYNTYYAGKLFNAHTVHNYDSPYVNGWNGSVRAAGLEDMKRGGYARAKPS